MQLEYKALPVSGFKVLDEPEGIIEAIVSVTGIVDRVRDNIKPGAYGKSLGQRTPKGVWGHDWNNPVSRTLRATELNPGHKDLPKMLPDGSPWPKEAGGVKVETQFNLETQAGRDAYSNVKFFGQDQEWSIGYQVPPGSAKVDSKSGIREIEFLDWYEYSPVLFGAMPFARNITEKSYADDDFKKPQMAFKALKDALGEDEAVIYFKDTEVEFAANEPGEGQSIREAATDDVANQGDTTEAADVADFDAADVIDVTTVTEVDDGTGEAKVYPNIDGSLESRQSAISEAVRAKFNTKTSLDGGVDTSYVYVSATFDDYAIISRYKDGKQQYYKVTYSMDSDNKVTVNDDAKEVQIRTQTTLLEEKVGRVLSAGNAGSINKAIEALNAASEALTAVLGAATREPSSATSEEKNMDVKPKKRASETDEQYKIRLAAWNKKTIESFVGIEFKDTLLAEEDVDTLADLAATFDEAVDDNDAQAANDAAEALVEEVEALMEESDDTDTAAALKKTVTEVGKTLTAMEDVDPEEDEDDSSDDEDADIAAEKVLIRLSGSDDVQEQKDGEPANGEKKTFDMSRLAEMRSTVKKVT